MSTTKGAARDIPPAVLTRQIAAADPERSVFVSANAGSGKTHVLAQRVINLLLRGEDPAKILCVTFTKAAAANMANRVFGTLAQWTALGDATLDEKITASTGKPSDAGQRATARRLFATALETPGGLKVQTIHAFCTRLLHQFPFEADVAARFDVLDDAATAQLLNDLTLEVMMEAAADPDGALGQALATAITSAADVTFKEVIAEAIRKRDLISAWTGRAGGVEKAIDELSRSFGLNPGDTLQSVEDEYISGSLIPQAEWPTLLAALSEGSAADKKHLAALQAARAANGRPRVDAYLQVFCKVDRTARDRILTNALAEKYPQWDERLKKEQDRVCVLVAREFALRARDRSAALITVAAAVIDRYAAEKAWRALLDYEDLIDKTLALFRKTSAAWVLYKLDLGINHVLVDEAQDTSPKQWEIIKTIVAEFVRGGARDNVRRTLFAVGDEKQSIFSFQGAAPLAFAQMQRYFDGLYKSSDTIFATEKLDYSFRSGPIVLGAVDAVFKRPEAFRGLSADPVWTVHQALPDAAPGEVEIWQLTEPDEKDLSKEGWDAPFDKTSETSPAIKLAGKIARTVKGWCAHGTRPRDVLVLVRQRGPLFEAVIRALKREGIEVAGADRLVLTEHIAVMDLLVLGDALLLPDDDLALATVLKSPLFGLNEDHLFELAWNRKGSLRAALRAKAGEKEFFGAIDGALDDLGVAARAMSPFAFYAHVLGARKGRKRLLARLGIEASDPLDEFLNLALDYEGRETPSLQGFLDWIRAAQNEIKRDMEMGRDEVRVMTVHGAKGLEAKDVILIDGTTTRPEGAHPPRLLTTPLANAPPGATALIWGVAKDKDAGPMAEARAEALEAARDEYRRLLYVAMTRAADRLVVCGVKGVNRIPENCWYELVLAALKPLSTESSDADGTVWHFSKSEPDPTAEKPATPPEKIELPNWLHAPAKPDKPALRVVRPSDAGEDDAHRFAGSGDRDKALRRGTLVHRLMQSLPDIAPDRREDAARRYLARSAKSWTRDFDEAEREAMAAQVLRLLNDPRFTALFAPGSRAEVSIAGKLEGARGALLIAGQIDRLVVTQEDVLIADYKTNRPTMARIADIPPMYVRQLALYRAVLQKLYPARKIRAVLVWTEVAELMELSAEDLDAALAGHLRVTSS